jgi:hypothetical protein
MWWIEYRLFVEFQIVWGLKSLILVLLKRESKRFWKVEKSWPFCLEIVRVLKKKICFKIQFVKFCPLCIFYDQNLHEIFCSSDLLTALKFYEISWVQQSFFINNINIDFIYFHTKWSTSKSLENGSKVNQFSKSFRFSLVGPQSSFLDLKLRDIKQFNQTPPSPFV